jgi:hypothetical protein
MLIIFEVQSGIAFIDLYTSNPIVCKNYFWICNKKKLTLDVITKRVFSNQVHP